MLWPAKATPGKTDVTTGPAQTSFLSYTTDRIASRADQEYA